MPGAVGEETFQQAAAVHHLNAAHMQAERAGVPVGIRPRLQHQHGHPVQPQFAGEHQPGRPAPGNDHIKHETPTRTAA